MGNITECMAMLNFSVFLMLLRNVITPSFALLTPQCHVIMPFISRYCGVSFFEVLLIGFCILSFMFAIMYGLKERPF